MLIFPYGCYPAPSWRARFAYAYVVGSIACLLVACDEAPSEPNETEPDREMTVTVSSGAGAGIQSCDAASFGCPVGMFCHTEEACGGGVCIPAPSICTGACDGVCACDGTWFRNACSAHLAGLEIDLDGSCSPPPQSYFATTIDGEMFEMLLLEYDPANDVCVRIMLTTNGDEAAPYDATLPPPWAIKSVVASHHALDCAFALTSTTCAAPAFSGDLVEASEATGSLDVKQDADTFPYEVSANLSLQFPDREWLDASDSFSFASTAPNYCFVAGSR